MKSIKNYFSIGMKIRMLFQSEECVEQWWELSKFFFIQLQDEPNNTP